MKRFYILGVAMGMSAFLSSLFGCHVSDGDFRSLSVAEFKEYIADTAVVRLDVRTAEEYGGTYCRGGEHRRVTTGFRTEGQGRFTERQDHSLVLPEWETQQESSTDFE